MIKPYLIIPIAFSILVLYFLSFFAMRAGLLSKSLHLKLWNISLIITFLFTAILGLILAFQVNYKIEIPFIKEILTIHVDFGIAMSFIAVFHLIWHIRYYIELLKPGKKILFPNNDKSISSMAYLNIEKNKLFTLLVVLGFSTSIVQVIMLREFISVFYSNELIFGIILSLWLTLTGIGAYTGNRQNLRILNRKKLFIICILPGLLPIVMVVMLNLLKNSIFPPGVLINIWQLIILVIIVLAPGCIMAGRIFSILSEIGQHSVPAIKGNKLYVTESMGSIFGGLIVSIIMIIWLNIMQSLIIVFAVSFITAYWILFFKSWKTKAIITSAIIFVVMLFFIFNIDLKIRQFLFKNQKVLETHETPYGNVTITETAGQYNVFENQELLFTTENIMENEEIAHFPLLQNPSLKKVLLISGGIAGIASEILKYNSIVKLDYIEPNPWSVTIIKKYFKLPADKRLNIYNVDGRKFLALSKEKYDVIIINLPEPSTLQLNRYYSSEFIKIIKQHLSIKGIVSLGLNSSADYLSADNKVLHSVLYNTLKQHFQNIMILQGEKDFFLASEKELNPAIGKLSSSSNIINKYVNSYNIDDRYLAERDREIQNEMIINSSVNTDFKPIAIYLQTVHFFNQFKTKSYLIIFITIILVLIPALSLKKYSLGMYVTGFSSASLEMLVIIAFQILFGFLYAASGIIFAIFMTGLVFGTHIKNYNIRFIANLKPLNILIIMIFLAFLIPVCLLYFSRYNSNWVLYPLVAVALLLPAILTGLQFTTSLEKFEIANAQVTSQLYRADLLGSALGFLLTAAVLIPLLGMLGTSCLLIIINLMALFVIYHNVRNEKFHN